MAPPGNGALTPERRATLVKQRARALGFEEVGITHLEPTPHGDALERWLAQGMAGTMRYMHRQAAHRLAPATIVPGATRAVMLAKNYYTSDTPRPSGTGHVAKYARGRDYHEALRPALEALAREIVSLGGAGTVARFFVDAGPVPERELAQRAGLGWVGKNTMLIDPKRGSFSFLAAVLTNADLAQDPPFASDRCGSCRLCLDACPTDAFPEPRVLDSRRCISYLTIEYKGATVDAALAGETGDWIFGCDICQDVCPWNAKFATVADDPSLAMDARLEWLPLEELDAMDAETFERRLGWTPLERPGPRGLRRNARLARANQEREAECRMSPKP